MAYEDIPIANLRVNRANDRHGEMDSEPLAIAELFRLNEQQMKNLAADIAAVGTVYDAPLVMPDGETYIVFDGNGDPSFKRAGDTIGNGSRGRDGA